MKYIRDIKQIPDNMPPCALTIGSFDGVHRGHQEIITTLLQEAKQRGLATLVISFDPYPKEFFLGERVPRLMTWREKHTALEALGVDYFLTINFNAAFAAIPARQFVTNLLIEKLHAKLIIVGDDFRFGQGREGDYALLANMAASHQFSVMPMPTFEVMNERVSSSRLRHVLQAGNMSMASDLLGDYYSLMGTVIHGDKLGRTLGYPTANIDLHRRRVPLSGVYVVRIEGIDQRIYYGAANIGTRPAVQGTRVLLEIFIFNFDTDIYGLNIKVSFLHKLRDEEDFESLDLLKEQIAMDVSNSKTWMAQNKCIISTC
ncbi:MAG: bifunctional riboflavin kinase/FMN adenylyltransferase [Coxiella sp. (in: Bacteria)]|nr:MAG: bifunctional riboflavin kinase/FMN adenylyltransferase [Coxiella sp. (in: g-proteobacteria)]